MTLVHLRPGILGLAAGLLIIAACTPAPLRVENNGPLPMAKLNASEQVAGDIMAYLMEVVLGKAGNPQTREAWATRGSGLPLDFNLVKNRMFGPVPLRAELMVLDTNILGLSEVLYHYDRRLNLFKGTGDHNSLYPCAELMAIRLLLIQKLARGEKVGMAAMVRKKALFAPGGRAPRPGELAEMNLTEMEFRFLKAVFASEPAFLQYMAHPFLLSTLKRIGAAQQDTVTLIADQKANYRRWSSPVPANPKPSTATIAILPSMNALFETAGQGLAPSREYRQLIDKLERAIVSAWERRVLERPPSADRIAPPEFITPLHPMVIQPDNAGRVIEDVCPQADFVVIVLGKNVYRAIDIAPDRDIYPHERRIYLDVSDIRYHQIDEEIDTIVEAVYQN